ncbi:polypyrimidine tract-binding protein homolog 3 [Tanacetum coccineum]
MASGGNVRNAEYALSKLLQMGTVIEYESEFVILANRVTVSITPNAIAARNSLQGRNIYEGCCKLDIQFLNFEELQSNQEEHICYYYWEHYFLILNAEEADNTKPPLFADTFGNNVGDDTGSEMVIGLPEEFQEGDMADALSRVLEQKSSEN